MINKNKFIKGIIVISCIISMTMCSNIKVLATENNRDMQTYQITKTEENNFLEKIYQSETEELKITNIDKELAEDNYINKEIFKTKTLNKKDKEYIYQEFGKIQNFNDNIYKGILQITDIKVETINNGYYEKIDEKILNFNNYTDNDLNNIEKEITIDNNKYYLIKVNWEADTVENIDGENVPITYKGSKIYQTVNKIANPSTYKITVKYSGQVERIDPIYNYTITYENKVKEIIEEEEKENNIVVPVIIISSIGLVVVAIFLLNRKNTYIYSKVDKGFKLIKKENLGNRNLMIDITNCKNKSKSDIYAIKINSITFEKLKGRTISIILGNKKKDIIIWNDYYEIKL